MKILRLIPNKREFLARAFGRMGVLGLLERTAASARPGLVVLTYHRIAEPAVNRFYEPVISATPDSFRDQIAWLCRHVRVLALDELIAMRESGSQWREPAALITFDDGYRDNFEVAVPILREHHVPATFFLPTAFLEAPRLPWWDEVAYVIKQTRVRSLRLEVSPEGGASPLSIDLEAMSRSAAIMTVIRAFLDETIADERWFLDQLSAAAEVAMDGESLARTLFTNWDQVRRCTGEDGIVTIGSHGHSHRRLAGLDEASQRHELTESKRILETRIGRAVEALAYPYGWPGCYTARTKAIAAESGYRLGFASLEGVNRPDTLDPHDIRRLGVGSGDSPALLRAGLPSTPRSGPLSSKSLSQEVVVGCSVSTDPGSFREYGAQRAPYESGNAAPEKVSRSGTTATTQRPRLSARMARIFSSRGSTPKSGREPPTAASGGEPGHLPAPNPDFQLQSGSGQDRLGMAEPCTPLGPSELPTQPEGRFHAR